MQIIPVDIKIPSDKEGNAQIIILNVTRSDHQIT